MPSRRETDYSCALTVLKTQPRHFNGKETMSSPDLHYANLLEASDAIRTRKVSPVELTHSMLEWIAKLSPQLHAYATVTNFDLWG
jgi:hypothetical protein